MEQVVGPPVAIVFGLQRVNITHGARSPHAVALQRADAGQHEKIQLSGRHVSTQNQK
jgi:hypothetical protein